MSNVTNIILNAGIVDGRKVEELNGRMRLLYPDLPPNYYALKDLTDVDGSGRAWGGSKVPEVDVFGGAFNHLDLPQYLQQVADVPWENRHDIQAFVNTQHGGSFDVYGWQELLLMLPTEERARIAFEEMNHRKCGYTDFDWVYTRFEYSVTVGETIRTLKWAADLLDRLW